MLTQAESKATVLSAVQIAELLPHAAPFVLVDRVIELEPGKRGKGLKNITANDVFLRGHFPGRPIMPGVLIVEACGQMAALVCAAEDAARKNGGGDTIAPGSGKSERPIEVLAMIERFKFLRMVSPGDQLILEAEVGKRVQQMVRFTVSARVGTERVAEGVLLAMRGE